ncbi:MAG: UvrD-helicase domain-containing protein [Endomicrobium sp.]|jgi:ATP-dependent exoDNAse (exonuclease V) beta subunit|nr:UvrD-helicase domain-containing protein [Endomicrobium sp.]
MLINTSKTYENKVQIISVQASAGSGKTYRLAKRYLYLLLSNDDSVCIKNIIAVTFTNKAAVEMKYRVINYLKIAALHLDTGEIFNNLKLTKDKISKKSAFILEEIFKYYDNFNISTIDSFKNHVLKSCAINMNISPNFIIKHDYSDILLFSLETFLKKAQTSERLKKITSRYLYQYLIKDLNWFPINNIYNEIEKIFKKSANTGKNVFVSKQFDFRYELVMRAKIIIDKLNKFSTFLPKLKISYHYSRAIKTVLNGGIKLFLSMNIPTTFACEFLKYKKDTEISIMANDLWCEINTEIQSLCDFYIENYYNIYSEIYLKVMAEFNEQSNRNGIIFLNEINKKIVDFFNKNNTSIPSVYYRLSEKYKHFLIDEFQDTSIVQWTGLKKFLEESLANDGTFFYVGDVKQAIYAFRDGRPELFDEAPNEFLSANTNRQYLKQNFRSGKYIVDFNNNIFSKENIENFLNKVYENKNINCDFSKFVEAYIYSKQESIKEHNYGYVEINIINKICKNEIEEVKQKFMNFVFQILKRFSAQNIAVLCRTNNEIVTVSSWLLEGAIEIESSQILNIKNNNIIKQIISFLRFINSPIDTLSFASFIIGDIFSKTSGIKNSELEKFIFIYKNNNKSGSLCKIFSDKYKDLWSECFESFFIKAEFMPVYELTLVVLEKFKITSNFHDSKVFIMCFLELIKEFEIQDSGLKNFLEHFNRLKDENDSLHIKKVFGNGIKVMTIHKSKGLQFPVVIIPFLKFSKTTSENPYFDDSEEKIKLLNISKNIAKFSRKAKEIYDNSKLRELLSELNILYVSMTRAKYELYAIVPQKSDHSNNEAITLFLNKNLISGTKQKYNLNNVVNNNFVLDNFDSNYKDIHKYFTSRKKTKIDTNDRKIKGTILHFALSKIISLKDTNIKHTIYNITNITKKKFYTNDVSFIGKKLEKLFTCKKVLRMFLYNENKIYNEKEIINSLGESFRIDKLIIDNEKIIILDFKSSNYDKIKIKNQLKNYAIFISEIYPYKKISTYIIDIEQTSCLRIL